MTVHPVFRRLAVLCLAVAISATTGALAKPFVPPADGVVVERLPEQADPSLKEIRRLRAALGQDPRNLDIAASVARRAIEAARTSGDPRFLGQAQAALMPWWTEGDPPSVALLLRATVKQSQHDFDGSIADLDRLLARGPNPQGLLTRATVLAVRGRFGEAAADCRKLARVTSALVVAACAAGPESLSGGDDEAYRSLTLALARRAGAPGIRAWALTLAAEIAARRGETAAADAHFREALALDGRDAYLRAAYADFLLDNERPGDAVALVREDTRNDSLLLRLVLAEQKLPESRASFEAHRAELAARFDAARARGDTLHQREEARFRLEIEGNGSTALALALANWKVQREPADLRILAQAAAAAQDADAQQVVKAWVASTHLRDATLASVRGAQR